MSVLGALAIDLQERLNGGTLFNDINNFSPNTKYQFRIMEDAGEFKAYERDGNVVTKYINGILSIINSDKNISSGYQTSLIWTEVISARLDLIIPDISMTRPGLEGKPIDFLSQVRNLIDEALSRPDATASTTLTYSYANTGEKAIREGVGESMTLTIFLTYYILHGGVNSSKYKIIVNNEEIRYLRLDVSRTSTQGAYTRSDSINYASGVRNEASSVVVSVTKPISGDILDEKIVNYLLYGINTPFDVKISMGEEKVRIFKMVISEGGNSAEAFLAASTTYTLVEYLDIDEEVENG